MVKVTGGQRLDIFGIKKEDLPAVWADRNAAGMVSGHAYAKALRTVKTCVGSNWCRFGTQDSTGLGIKTEQMTWGSFMPHKFKIAVSGCPRNCAEVGLEYIKKRIVEDVEGRVALTARFHFSQRFMQDDPWAKRAAGEDYKLHQHLAEIRPLAAPALVAA